MSTIQLLPATTADIPALALLQHTAFSDPATSDRLVLAMYPRVPLSAQIQDAEKGMRDAWEKPGRRFFKAVQRDSGVIVGFCKWYFPYTAGEEGEDRVPVEWVEGCEVKLCEEFWGRLYRARKENMDHEKDYFVDVLVVSPPLQRRGIGKMLLEAGLEKVDVDGARCYIEATQEGQGLYEKLGWKQIGGMEVDLSEWGLGSAKRTFLMREPRNSVGS